MQTLRAVTRRKGLTPYRFQISRFFFWNDQGRLCSQDRMNVLPLIGFLFYVQRILGSPGGKHCKLLEGNVWRKVVLMPKKTIFEGVRGFFAAILSEMDLDHVDTWEV